MNYLNDKAIGIDIVNVCRIKKILEDRKESFYNKILTEGEKKYVVEKEHSPNTVSGIFAAKEAISKVLGTGIGDVGWKDIEIYHDNNGKPNARFLGNGKNIARKLGINIIDISISHEREYAIAFAIGLKEKNNIFIQESMKGILPRRNEDGHKGTYGRVAIIGGKSGMTGASYLSSMAALRSGSGLVYCIIPKSLETIMSIKLTEAIIVPIEDNGKGHFTEDSIREIKNAIKNMDAIAIGPGLGVSEERTQLIKEILTEFKGTIVLDADRINCLLSKDEVLINRNGHTIITPHPGELARLLQKSTSEIQKNRIYYSKYASEKYNIITVLKGKGTVVTSKEETYINSTGNPGMATAGTGDILTGIILSFLGQGIDPFKSAILGVYCHGLSGDISMMDKGEYGLIATDILDNIPYSLKKIQE